MAEIVSLEVAGKSNPKSVAGSIVNNIREGNTVEITVMGPNAVNQAMKAIAIARGYIETEDIDIYCRPEFAHLTLEGEEKSAMKFVLITKEVNSGI